MMGIEPRPQRWEARVLPLCHRGPSDEFKKAIVTPLIKKSSLPPNDLKNYRPVSGLGFISKLVERVVASQLSDHVSLNGLENVR